MGASGLATALVAFSSGLIQGPGPRTGTTQTLGLTIGVVGIGLILVRPALPVRAATEAARVRRAITLSAIAALAGVPVLALLAVHRSAAADLDWYFNSFLDKRFVLAGYWLFVGCAVVLFPCLLRGIEALGEGRAGKGPEDEAPQTLASPDPLRARGLRVAGAALLACLFYGPPWHVAELPLALDFHETLHLGGLQVIHQGGVPFTEGRSMYGPATQWLISTWMEQTSFSIAGLRQAFAAMNLAAALIVFSTMAWLLPTRYLLVALPFAVSFSPFALWWFGTGELRSFFGWANSLRYVGSFLLLACLPALVLRMRTGRPHRLRLLGLGFVLGLGCLIGPENLAAAVLGGGMFLALVWATRTLELDALVGLVALVVAGAVAAVAPVLLAYLLMGQLGEFMRSLFESGGLIAAGWANHPWRSLLGPRWAVAYYASPFVFAGLALLALRAPKATGLRLARRPLDRDALLLAAAASICLASFSASLTRSDEWHLMGPLIGLPLLAACAARHIPRTIAGGPSARAAAGALVVAVLLIVYPTDLVRTIPELAGSLARPWVGAPPTSILRTGIPGHPRVPIRPMKPVAPRPTSPSHARLGFAHRGEADCCETFLRRLRPSFADLLRDADWFRTNVGERPIVIAPIQNVNGYLYFLADLVPGTSHTQPLMTLPNSALRERWYEELDLESTECVLGLGRRKKEEVVERFRAVHADATATVFESSIGKLVLWCRP